jgi:S-DNA-T family DNA segregation ATPase FtsK/SpoIIIE
MMLSQRVIREIIAVALLLGAALTAVALVSHNPQDPSLFFVSSTQDRPTNLIGWLGANLSAALLDLVGLASLLVPILAALFGWRLLRGRTPESGRLEAVGWLLVFLGLPGLLSFGVSEVSYRGGVLSLGGVAGRAATELLSGFAGAVGAVGVLSFVVLAGVLLISGLSVERLGLAAWEWLQARLGARREERAQKIKERVDEHNRRRVLERQWKRMQEETAPPESVTVKHLPGKGGFRIIRRRVDSGPDGGTGPGVAFDDAGRPGPPRREEDLDPVVHVEPSDDRSEAVAQVSKRPKVSRKKKFDPPTRPPAPVLQEEFDFVEDLESYDLPRVSFLEPQEENPRKDTSELVEIGRVVTEKCQEFRVRGEVENIRTGPVITTYEFRLDSGVKIAAVQNLSEDLALALKTSSVRIERIPGRATVGIEVPNPDPEVIRISKVLDSAEFRGARSLLTLSLGVDIRGKPFVADLQRMPHLLVGGFTGSGKSVGINAMILSILYKAQPHQVKFILVDPKMVELGVYSDIPHLLTPIITEPKKAANALGWAVDEMDGRYRKLASLGVRNLEQYNQLVEDREQLARALEQFGGEAGPEATEAHQPMPYIVIIIDELADLMMTSGRAVEEAITRIAQKARAVGLHLICATQRPSVDVLTGIIKANFPCRIAYKVRSKHDSRTILDAIGAEHLIGRGDMLFLPPGTSNVNRLHGPLVTEKEIASVVRYIKRFGKPEYRKEVLNHQPLGDVKGGARTSGGVIDPDDVTPADDPMYESAARLVVKERKASASHIQRRLRLGYTRSARLLDMMENEGLVGPPAGSKGRDVLVPENHFGEVDETHALNGPDEED